MTAQLSHRLLSTASAVVLAAAVAAAPQPGHAQTADEVLTTYADIAHAIYSDSLATALVLSGNTLPDHYKFLINSTGIIPDYVCESAVMEQ